MQLTRWYVLATAGGVGLAISALVIRFGQQRGVPLSTPWVVSVTLLIACAILLGMGLRVRQYVKGKRPEIDPLRAARILGFAKAFSLVGAGLAGFYFLQAGYEVFQVHTPASRERLIFGAIATLASLITMAVGLIVERFCRLPPGAAGEEPDEEVNAA